MKLNFKKSTMKPTSQNIHNPYPVSLYAFVVAT